MEKKKKLVETERKLKPAKTKPNELWHAHKLWFKVMQRVNSYPPKPGKIHIKPARQGRIQFLILLYLLKPVQLCLWQATPAECAAEGCESVPTLTLKWTAKQFTK